MTKAELIVRLEGLEGAVEGQEARALSHELARALFGPSCNIPQSILARTAIGDGLEALGSALALVSEKLPREQSGILREAWSAVSKQHALHMRFWNPETDGDYAHAIARRVLIALLKSLPEGEAK